MNEDIETLPDNVEELKEIISTLREEMAGQHDEIAKLRQHLHYLLHQRYGRRTEKLSSTQLNFFDEPELDASADVDAIQLADEAITVAAHTRQRTGRKPLPADLPRERIVHDIPQAEQICACGHVLHRIGEDICEKLEFIPAQVKVIEHVRCKYACRQCQGSVTMAPLPLQPIPKSIAGPGLLSHVLVSKYVDHQPLYRQEVILQRMGIDIARATLCFWVLRSAALLAPLVQLMRQDIVAGHYVQADETPVQVFNTPNKTNTSKSYIWLYRGGALNKKAVVFEYQPTRSGTAAQVFLADFKGALQTDGYAGYHAISARPDITHAGCWAHVRRKFIEVIKLSKTPGRAQEAVAFIRELYAVEKTAREQMMAPPQRQALRQLHATPVLIRFKHWLDDVKNKVSAQTHIGKAIAYALNQWDTLVTYIDNGEIEIDNNAIENDIRPFALGRKNWLFMGSQRGAEAGAIIYSLLATCKAHVIEPYAYLKYVLDRLPHCRGDDDRKKLLPYHVDQAALIKAYSTATWDK